MMIKIGGVFCAKHRTKKKDLTRGEKGGKINKSPDKTGGKERARRDKKIQKALDKLQKV
ncbi:MAG: hypothetical protein IJ740_16965 [Ruminococcus sp.]|nr:hypothetical protein [Ruminococcus sp.]